MAESTGSGDSVGKISLDLEVTSDLSNQINKVSNTIGKKLKDTMDNATKTMFDGMSEGMNKNMQSMNNSLKNGLDKMKQNIRSTFTSALDVLKNIKMPAISFPKIDIARPNTNDVKSQPTTRGPPKSNVNTAALKAEIENTASALDIVNAKIEQQQAKLAQLKETYANTFNAARKNRIEEQILKTEAAINGLINKSDKLGFKLSDLDAKLASAGTGAGEAASKINTLSNKTNGFTGKINGALNGCKSLLNPLKNLGSTAKSTGNNFNGMGRGLGNIARQFATWMIILPLVMKGLEAMTSGLLADLKTNEQFNTSLNQIKTNLMVAFTPIFYAILPAINALMSALATATTYIASFISAIFGKTYQQSYQATQGLIDAKKAMGAYGDSAKKAAKDVLGLAGFDEINKLSKSDSGNDDNSKVPTLTQPSLDTGAVDSKMQALADKFKEILGKIFEPMKQAWDQEGKATMDALKYALGSIWDLAKDIGKTFLDIWSNGTGLKICTDILKLLQTIFNIIGDIATAFKTAWDKGDLGKQVVQALFNAFDAILKLLIDIGNTFRDVWNSSLGVEICTNILEILKNIFTIIGQIATSFKTAWDSGLGKQLITDILNLLNGCLRVIKDITASFSKAWETNGNTIAAGILLILDDIVGTISDIANKWANAWENKGAGDTLMNSLLSTLGKILTTVGDIGKGIRESIGKAADTIFPAIIQFATDVSTGLGNLTDGFKAIWDNGGKTLFDGIVQLIAQIANLILQLSSGVFTDFSTLFKNTLAPAIGAVFDVLGTVLGKLSEFVGWINTNKPIIDVLTKAVEGFMIAWEVTKIAAFIQMSGGLVGAITSITTALVGSTAAKIADGLETMAITAMYAGQFISSLVSSTSQLVAQAAQFTINTGLKIADTAAQTAMTAATVAWNAVCVIATTVTTALGAAIAFLTSPIGLVVIAITGLIAAGVLLYQHWDVVKQKSSECWQYVQTQFRNFQAWLDGVFAIDWSNQFGSIGDIINGFMKIVEDVEHGVSTALQGIIDFVTGIFTGDWSTAWKGVQEIFKGIFEGLRGIAMAPLNGIIALINGVITAINDMVQGLNNIHFSIPDWVPGLGGESFSLHIPSIPKVPYLATGGIIDSPTLAMVGEAGKEAVVPLENNTEWMDTMSGKLAEKLLGALGTSSGVSNNSDDGDLIVQLKIGEDKIGDIIIKQFRKLERKTGKAILNL